MIDEAFQKLKAESEDGKFAVGSYVLGPFTMAGQVYELDLLLKGLRKDRERVLAFLGQMTDLVIRRPNIMKP